MVVFDEIRKFIRKLPFLAGDIIFQKPSKLLQTLQMDA